MYNGSPGESPEIIGVDRKTAWKPIRPDTNSCEDCLMHSLVRRLGLLSVLAGGASLGWAEQAAITVYNQNFGVVRENIKLDLKIGVNDVRYADMTAHLEPDSVILRDPAGKRRLMILEQNYRNDPISQELLLSLYEGQTLDFLTPAYIGSPERIIKAKIIRSGYVPHYSAMNRYGQQYWQGQMQYAGGGAGVPLVEVEGKLRFGLPGQPLFPELKDDTILKPTLNWKIETDAAGPLNAELAYVTGGMTWEADYNVIAPETGDLIDLIGWVTIDNQTGRTFADAKIKLMAGDVKKIQPEERYSRRGAFASVGESSAGMPPPVSEKSFDEYHLYSLTRATTLRDRETKQVEFVRGDDVQSQRVYVYDGAFIDPNRYQGWNYENIRNDHSYGTESNPKVWVMREFDNTEKNHLGIPLPAGRVRFYRQDDDGRLEFVGENRIDHTPKDERVRVYTGNAFDLVGERRRTDFKVDSNGKWMDETFEIKVRNHKKEPVDVRIVEHLYRWYNCNLTQKSMEFGKKDAQTIEFPVTIAPDKEAVVTYTVHYSW